MPKGHFFLDVFEYGANLFFDQFQLHRQSNVGCLVMFSLFLGFIDFIVDPSFQVMGDMLDKIIIPLQKQQQQHQNAADTDDNGNHRQQNLKSNSRTSLSSSLSSTSSTSSTNPKENGEMSTGNCVLLWHPDIVLRSDSGGMVVSRWNAVLCYRVERASRIEYAVATDVVIFVYFWSQR